eukprot:795157_1
MAQSLAESYLDFIHQPVHFIDQPVHFIHNKMNVIPSVNGSSDRDEWGSRHDRFDIGKNAGYLTTWLNISKLMNELDGHQIHPWISNHTLHRITKTVFSGAKEFIATLREHNDLTSRQLNTIYNTLKNEMLHNTVDTASHSKSPAKTSMRPYNTANDLFEHGIKPLLSRCLIVSQFNVYQTYHSLLLRSFSLIGEPRHLRVLPMSRSRVSSRNEETIEITESNCLSVSQMALTLKNPHSLRGHTVYFTVVKMKGLADVYFIAVDLAGLELAMPKDGFVEGLELAMPKDGFVEGLELVMPKDKLKLNKKQMKGFETICETRSLEAGCINNGFTQRQTIFILSILGASANNNKVTVIEQMNPWKCVPRISKQPIITRATLNFAKQTQLVKFDTYTQRASAKIHKKDTTIKALNAMIMQRFMLQSVNTMDIAPFLGAWSDDDLTWLNISKLLNELEEHQWISNHALQLIIEAVFSNTKAFIATLWEHNHLTCRQLNTIYNTLKNTMLHNPLNTVSHSKTVSSFAALSIPSITNICSYLTMSDILSFKNTSINIAIIALHEMSKYHIGVFNMNELFDHYSNFSILKNIKTGDVIKNERYPPSMTFKKMVEVWSKHYDIKPSNMALLCSQSSGWQFSWLTTIREPFIQFVLGQRVSKRVLVTKLSDISDFRVKQMKAERFDNFLLLDKTKMSVLCDIEHDNKCNEDTYATSCEVLYDKSTEWSCSMCTFINRLSHSVCDMCGTGRPFVPDNAEFNVLTQRHQQQCLILLNYFDLKQQKILFCRALIVHEKYSSNDLKTYIAKHIQLWIPECDEELSQLLHHMKAYNNAGNMKNSIIRMYKYTDTHRGYVLQLDDDYRNDQEIVRECVEMYVFQLNPSHHLMSVSADNYISKLRIYYEQILNESFWVDPTSLGDDSIRFSSKWWLNTGSEERLFYGNSFSDGLLTLSFHIKQPTGMEYAYMYLSPGDFFRDDNLRINCKHLDKINKRAKQKRIRKDISRSVKYQKKMSKNRLYKTKKHHYHRW